MEVDRAARLTALLQHPAWPELVATVAEERDKYMRATMKNLMATGNIPDNFEYKRGFFAGLVAVTVQPDIALKVIERLAKEQKGE